MGNGTPRLDAEAVVLAPRLEQFGLDSTDLDMLKRGDKLGSIGAKIFRALQQTALPAGEPPAGYISPGTLTELQRYAASIWTGAFQAPVFAKPHQESAAVIPVFTAAPRLADITPRGIGAFEQLLAIVETTCVPHYTKEASLHAALTAAKAALVTIKTIPPWIEHDGRSDPDIAGDSEVEVLFRDGDTARGLMHDWDQNWQWAGTEEGRSAAGAIVAYRILPAGSLPMRQDIETLLARAQDMALEEAAVVAENRIKGGMDPSGWSSHDAPYNSEDLAIAKEIRALKSTATVEDQE